MVLQWWWANRPRGPCAERDGFGLEVKVDGRRERHWQAVGPRWRKMSAASCHVVFAERWKTHNHKSGAAGRASLSLQLWSDPLRQTFCHRRRRPQPLSVCNILSLIHSQSVLHWGRMRTKLKRFYINICFSIYNIIFSSFSVQNAYEEHFIISDVVTAYKQQSCTKCKCTHQR